MVCSYAWFLKYCPNQVFAWAFLNIVSQSDHLNIGNMQLRKRVDIFFFKSWQMGGGPFLDLTSYLCWVCRHCLVELRALHLLPRLPKQKLLSSPCRRSASWKPPRTGSWSQSCPCPRSWCCPRCSSTPGCSGTSRPCRLHLSCWAEKNEFNIKTF